MNRRWSLIHGEIEGCQMLWGRLKRDRGREQWGPVEEGVKKP